VIYILLIFLKIIVESIKKNKSKLYILQHGGLYFFSKTMHDQQHELKICDKYLAFGKNNFNKVIKFYNIKLLGKKLLKSSNKHDISFIQTNCSKYFHSNLNSTIFSGCFIKYLNNQVIFVKKLKVNLRKKLVIRYPDYNIKWQENLRWKNQFRNLKIDYGKLPLIKVLNDFKICVVSYNGTSMLETLSLNFPTIIFWDHKIENLDKRGLYYIKILRSAGIFFDSAQAASDKINKIYKNVDLWWNTQKVQEARKIFCNQYNYVDDNKNYKALSHLIKNYD
jgi:putative transferase (TIGR04331 family)